MQNIYYLRNQQSWQTDAIASATSGSRLRRPSPTSRKTEPKRSLSIKHRIRQHPTSQPVGLSNSPNRKAQQQQSCSTEQRKPAIIHFRRVQQPSNAQTIGAASSRKEVSIRGKGHSKCEARSKDSQTQQRERPAQQFQQDSLSAFQGLYSLQPMRKVFLCRKCIAYLPTIEIRSHFAHCTAPKSRQQHLERWTKIAQLLQEINSVQPHSQLFKVADLMLAYTNNQRTEGTGLLYSQELSRILACRPVLSTGCLDEGQLFELLERLGDKLETVPRQGWCS